MKSQFIYSLSGKVAARKRHSVHVIFKRWKHFKCFLVIQFIPKLEWWVVKISRNFKRKNDSLVDRNSHFSPCLALPFILKTNLVNKCNGPFNQWIFRRTKNIFNSFQWRWQCIDESQFMGKNSHTIKSIRTLVLTKWLILFATPFHETN